MLEIATADSGKPVPNVGLEYWQQEGPQHRYHGSLQSTRFGVWQVPVVRTTATALQLVSHVDGFEAYPVEVEVNAGYGDTIIVIVGLPDAAVKESRDRVSH